jgi:uncharacterized protein with HEPN domain
VRDDEVYLTHIADCIALVEQYLTVDRGSLSEWLFHDDLKTQDAVLLAKRVMVGRADGR